MNQCMEKEREGLASLARVEELLEKKTKIYSRLLTDAALAKSMEELSLRHEQRKRELLSLVAEKELKKAQGQTQNEEES